MSHNQITNKSILERAITLTDNCRCEICDKLQDRSVRFSCGHDFCENCVSTAENCILCSFLLSPPEVPGCVRDGPLDLRAEHASKLLDWFQKLYIIDGSTSSFKASQKSEKPKGVLILSESSSSDSDSVILPSVEDSLLEIPAGVHRSETKEHGVRRHTPASTESSDIEKAAERAVCPNRAKRPKIDKKDRSKK